jgi:HSP20 family protein
VGKVMMADLLRWNPVDEMRRFTDMFDRQLSRWRSGSAFIGSPVDTSISNMDDGYRVRIPLPGIAPENVTVDVAGQMVHVRAIERDGDSEMVRYEEVLTLPASVDTGKIGATLRYGLLELTVPYQEAVKPRRVEIATTTGEPKQLPMAA